MEQTNSQILHPEHRSGTTANFQDIFFSLLRQFPPIERLCRAPLFVIASDRRKRGNLLGVMNLVQHLVLSIGMTSSIIDPEIDWFRMTHPANFKCSSEDKLWLRFTSNLKLNFNYYLNINIVIVVT